MTVSPDLTGLICRLEQGDPTASEQLLPIVYEELRKLAAARIGREKPGQTLQATALVHEAYLKLVEGDKRLNWESRGHFFGAAAEAMRQILIDRARRRRRGKHGGDHQRRELEFCCLADQETPDRLLAIDDALAKLEREHPDAARLLKLRYYVGVPLKDGATMLGISLATAKRRWAFARAFLYGELSDT